jgi:hypothetical protein
MKKSRLHNIDAGWQNKRTPAIILKDASKRERLVGIIDTTQVTQGESPFFARN